MPSPEFRLDDYAHTHAEIAREYPLRLALFAAIACLIFLLGQRLGAVVWWLAMAGVLWLEKRAYDRFFAGAPARVSRAKALEFAALSLLCSMIYVWPVFALIAEERPATHFGAAAFVCGSLIHLLVHNGASRLIFAAAATPLALAFAFTGVTLSLDDGAALPVLMVGVFLWAAALAFEARAKASLRIRAALAEAEEARAAAERASAAKSLFLAKMSHELRTPLNGVLGLAAALRAEAKDTQDRARLDAILACGDTLLGLVEATLDHAAIEGGRLALNLAPTDLGRIVTNAAELFRPAAASKGLALTVDLPAAGADRYLLDGPRLSRALMHLVSNAVKFTEAGAVLVKLRAEGPHIEIEVSDTGRGMSAAELLSVFDAFEQADNSLTRAYDGAGLGLTVARGIIEAMDGTLRARSEKGRGATFTATFQAAPAPRPDAISETKPALVPGAVAVPPRILLVEDNLVNREVVKALLRPVTISVVEAENGAEALERLEDGAFDLILMDLHMPVMDGLSAIRAVRALQRPVASTPIVVLTAATSEEDRVRSIDAGADGFLAKPVKARDLAGAVRRFAAGEWRASA